MVLPSASTEVILCGIATYLVVAPLLIAAAGVCGWLVRQSELAAHRPPAEGEAVPPATSAHALPPTVAVKNEPPVSTAA
jgi:hypothetical protein